MGLINTIKLKATQTKLFINEITDNYSISIEELKLKQEVANIKAINDAKKRAKKTKKKLAKLQAKLDELKNSKKLKRTIRVTPKS